MYLQCLLTGLYLVHSLVSAADVCNPHLQDCPIGLYKSNPAQSCKEVADTTPEGTTDFSDYYWIYGQTAPIQVFCDVEKELDNSKGWARVALLNMTDPEQSCPDGFKLLETASKRVCMRSISGAGCNSVLFSTGFQYQKVCGRVVGYQYDSPDAFDGCPTAACSIDEHYVDGISITHGNPSDGKPRNHVWTYAAGLTEKIVATYQCPCANTAGSKQPSFVGEDYYCESGIHEGGWSLKLYADDPLWDGQQCGGQEGPCCANPDLPWFCKELPTPTTDPLEVRICGDQPTYDEDVPFELVELYVQ